MFKKIILTISFILLSALTLAGDKWIGAGFLPVSDDLRIYTKEKNAELIVCDLVKGQPAQQSGLLIGDIILTVNDKPVKTVLNIIDEIQRSEIIRLEIIRQSKKEYINIKPIKRPDKDWELPIIGEKINKEMFKIDPEKYNKKHCGNNLPSLHLDDWAPTATSRILPGKVNEWGVDDFSDKYNSRVGINYTVKICTHNYKPRNVEFFKININQELIDHEILVLSYPSINKVVKIPNREKPNDMNQVSYLVGIYKLSPNTTERLTIELLNKKICRDTKEEKEVKEYYDKLLIKRSILLTIYPIEPPQQYVKMFTELQ
jgi:hypothetical protein